MFVDVLPLAERAPPLGVRLDHRPRRAVPELLDDPALTAQWIEAGCLIQVTAQALAEPWDAETGAGAPAVGKGGFVHLLGSDGHGIDRRRPVLAAGFERLFDGAGVPPPSGSRATGASPCYRGCR